MISPTEAANRVLDELGINDRDDLKRLEEIAWTRGAVVRRAAMNGAEGRIAMAGQIAVITIPAESDPLRQRFGIAHELGHLELHRNQSALSMCLGDDMLAWGDRESAKGREQEANEFAASLLLPERFFAPACSELRPSLDMVSGLAEGFETSLTSTALRYMDFCAEPAAVVYSSKGVIRWLRRSYDFKDLGYFVEPRTKLHPQTRAASFFKDGTASRIQGPVLAESWLTSGRFRSNATLLEQSWPMPSQSAVLTLLWVNQDIEDGGDW
ncbi:MAG: ImmA/IrrE family metallo-endopeptidase [Ardenticatenia bacterium]|nr:ImmA/IrrE family metallo-endopeptidase [Ardenticatenia bacterium]